MGPTDWLDRFESWSGQDFLAPSESDSDRDGFLSYKAEWHALGWGFAAVFLATVTGQRELVAAVVLFLVTGQRKRATLNLPYPKQITKESAYALGAGVVAYLLARALLIFI